MEDMAILQLRHISPADYTTAKNLLVKALKQWTFTPGRVNGKPATVRITMKVDYER